MSVDVKKGFVDYKKVLIENIAAAKDQAEIEKLLSNYDMLVANAVTVQIGRVAANSDEDTAIMLGKIINDVLSGLDVMKLPADLTEGLLRIHLLEKYPDIPYKNIDDHMKARALIEVSPYLVAAKAAGDFSREQVLFEFLLHMKLALKKANDGTILSDDYEFVCNRAIQEFTESIS